MTFILTAHILLMSASLTLTAGSTFAAAFSKQIGSRITVSNILITSLGMLLGVVMILQNPIDMKCALLTAYLLGFTASYTFIKKRNQLLVESAS